MSYEEFFERNLGVFAPEEQQRIREVKVAIFGCGGIGGVVALVLARSGVGHFTLMDPECYEPSNVNRQIACFCDTIGTNKAVCVRENILKVNPKAEVTVHERALVASEIEEVAKLGDVIVPVMDEWPLSLTVLEVVRKSKPAVMAYPVGALGRVSVFLAESPSVAECLAMPYGFGYEELKDYTMRPEARRLLQYYVTEGQWTEEWFEQWVQGKLPHAQICATVWITSSLAALEILKLVTGKWKPVVAPYYWHITPTNARIRKFGVGRRLISRLSRRERVQRNFPRLTSSKRLLRLFTRLLG